MADFKKCNTFDSSKNDYYTQKIYWEKIAHLIPKDKIIYEAFLLNSKSKSIDYLKELGFDNVVGHDKLDFLNHDLPKYDLIVSNPPFETKTKTQILQKLCDLNKPFIIVINISCIFAKYFRDIFKNQIHDLQIIKPNGRIGFEEYNQNTDKLDKCKMPAFYNCYLAYKMNIPEQQLWLK